MKDRTQSQKIADFIVETALRSLAEVRKLPKDPGLDDLIVDLARKYEIAAFYFENDQPEEGAKALHFAGVFFGWMKQRPAMLAFMATKERGAARAREVARKKHGLVPPAFCVPAMQHWQAMASAEPEPEDIAGWQKLMDSICQRPKMTREKAWELVERSEHHKRETLEKYGVSCPLPARRGRKKKSSL